MHIQKTSSEQFYSNTAMILMEQMPQQRMVKVLRMTDQINFYNCDFCENFICKPYSKKNFDNHMFILYGIVKYNVFHYTNNTI